MANGADNKVAEPYVDRELSARELAMMDAFAVRSGDGGGAVTRELDDDLEAELEGMLRLSHRIAAIDEPAPAASVRGAVMSEAVAAIAAREERPANGLVTLLLALLRPGPVLALGAVVALAVAISVRQDRQPGVERGEASMVAMREPGAADRATTDRTAADRAASAAAAARPAPPSGAVPQTAALGAEIAGEPAPAAGDDDEAKALGAKAAGEAAGDTKAAEAAAGKREAAEVWVDGGSERPKRAIAASPASVGPNGAPLPVDEAPRGSPASDAPAGGGRYDSGAKVAAASAQAERRAQADGLGAVASEQDEVHAAYGDGAGSASRQGALARKVEAAVAESDSAATTMGLPAAPKAPAEAAAAPQASAAQAKAKAVAAPVVAQRTATSSATSAPSAPPPAAKPEPAPSSKASADSAAASPPPSAPGSAYADRVSERSATRDDAEAVREGQDAAAERRAAVAKIQAALGRTKATNERVALLEKLIALLGQDKDAGAELAKAKAALAEARKGLAGDGSGAAKAAPMKKARASSERSSK